jgi:predicted transposase YdaD
LKPLVVTRKAQIVEEIHQWKDEIRALTFSEEKIQTLLELLEYLIIQRFPSMTRKEIERMLHLTPIEETVVGRELIQIGKQEGRQEGRKEGINKGRKEGRQEGINKGELIGEIRATQKFLKRPVTPVDDLAPKSLKALNVMLQELEAELAKLN